MTSAKQRFLEYYKEARSKATYKSYKRGLVLFAEYYGKSCDIALKQRRKDVASEDYERNQRFVREIEKFHQWLLKQGYSVNSSRTMTLGIMQLFRYYGVPIVLPPQSKVSRTVVSTRTYIPKIEQLRRMFQLSDLREKVILSLGLDLAWRISDFIQIKREDLPDLNQKPPIPFEVITGKEQVISSTFISSETVELLKVYFPTLSKTNPYLFPSNGKRHLKDEAINGILKKLAVKAKLKIPKRKRLTFHSLRKRFLSTAYTIGIDNEISKLLVGKSIGKAIETYLEDANLKQSFIKIRETSLNLTNGRFHMDSEDSEIAKLKKENETLKLQIRGLSLLFQSEILSKAGKKLEKFSVIQASTEPKGEKPIETILEAVAKAEKQRQKREYDKMLAETNGFNHKS